MAISRPLLPVDNEQGTAIIELSLSLLFLLFLVLIALETSLVLRHWQKATALSRELASAGFRECAVHRGGLLNTRFDPEGCLNSKIPEIFGERMRRVAPEASYIVQLYTNDGGLSRDGGYEYRDVNQNATLSKYPLNVLQTKVADPDSPFGTAIGQYGTIVIGEVYLPYSGLLNLVERFINYEVRFVYGATIL